MNVNFRRYQRTGLRCSDLLLCCIVAKLGDPSVLCGACSVALSGSDATMPKPHDAPPLVLPGCGPCSVKIPEYLLEIAKYLG